MEKYEILDKLEDIWDAAQSRNIGSGESELDFKHDVADWLLELYREIKTYNF